MIRIVLATIAGLALTGLAVAQSKKASPTPEEAKAKVDANKVAICKDAKKYLADEKAKGFCLEDYREAAKLTCTPQTSKQVTQLAKRCNKASRPKPPPTPDPAAPAPK
jgi:hypothetical protein